MFRQVWDNNFGPKCDVWSAGPQGGLSCLWQPACRFHAWNPIRNPGSVFKYRQRMKLNCGFTISPPIWWHSYPSEKQRDFIAECNIVWLSVGSEGIQNPDGADGVAPHRRVRISFDILGTFKIFNVIAKVGRSSRYEICLILEYINPWTKDKRLDIEKGILLNSTIFPSKDHYSITFYNYKRSYQL